MKNPHTIHSEFTYDVPIPEDRPIRSCRDWVGLRIGGSWTCDAPQRSIVDSGLKWPRKKYGYGFRIAPEGEGRWRVWRVR